MDGHVGPGILVAGTPGVLMFDNFFRTTPRRRLITYVLLVALAVYGLWRYQLVSNEAHDAALQAQATAKAEAAEDEVEEAEACITAWGVREDIRDAIQLTSNGTRRALVEAIGPFARSRVNLEAFAKAYAETQGRAVEAARKTIPDPECPLQAAEKRIRAANE